MRLFINTKREGYSPEQCGGTITVRKLRELLEIYDDNTRIYLKNDNGYTYGSITKWQIEEGDEEEDDE